MCNCPAGFGAGAERHAPDCPGRFTDKIQPTPVTAPLRPSLAKKWDCPKLPTDFEPGYSAQRAAALEIMQKSRHEHEELTEALLLDALGMTREEAVANRLRITQHCHPGKTVWLLDGEPVIEFSAPQLRHDELVTGYKVLRKVRSE